MCKSVSVNEPIQPWKVGSREKEEMNALFCGVKYYPERFYYTEWDIFYFSCRIYISKGIWKTRKIYFLTVLVTNVVNEDGIYWNGNRHVLVNTHIKVFCDRTTREEAWERITCKPISSRFTNFNPWTTSFYLSKTEALY